MELVLDGTRADSCIREQVGKIAVNLRIEDFFGAGEARFAHHAGIHLADGDDAAEHVFLSFRIRLVQHALVADTDGARLARVDARHDEDLIFDLFLHRNEAMDVVEYGFLVIGRTRADDEQEAVVLPSQDGSDFLVALCLDVFDAPVQRELLHEFLRRGQFADEFHLHFHSVFPSLVILMASIISYISQILRIDRDFVTYFCDSPKNI